MVILPKNCTFHVLKRSQFVLYASFFYLSMNKIIWNWTFKLIHPLFQNHHGVVHFLKFLKYLSLNKHSKKTKFISSSNYYPINIKLWECTLYLLLQKVLKKKLLHISNSFLQNKEINQLFWHHNSINNVNYTIRSSNIGGRNSWNTTFGIC